MEVISENPKNISLIKLIPLLKNLNLSLKLNLDNLFLHLLSDEEVLFINKQYLTHDYFTDIITFDLRDEYSKEAELFISIDRIKENAESYFISEEEELSRVCIHGMLHLFGLDDKTEKEKSEMQRQEKKYLELLFHVKR